MKVLLINYYLILFSSGFVVLLILSVFAFGNAQALRIKEGKHNDSGITLVIVSFV